MVDIETPEAKKNGTGGTLIHSKIKVLPLGPAGPFEIDCYLIAMEANGPQPVGHMTFRADRLPLIEFGLVEFRKAYAAAIKGMIEEAKAAQLVKPSAETVRRIVTEKGS